MLYLGPLCLTTDVCFLLRHLLDEPSVQTEARRDEQRQSVQRHCRPHAEEPAQTAQGRARPGNHWFRYLSG